MLGELISGGAALLGYKANRENTKDSIEYQEGRDRMSEALQREFAQNGIRWRTEDAKAAGLHPLYALGGAGASFTPSAASVNFDNGGNALARGLSDIGQNITRAHMAQQTPMERALQQANLRILESQLGESDARRELLIAQRRKLEQEAAAAAPMDPTVTNAYGSPVAESYAVSNDGRGTRLEAHPLFADAVKLNPDQRTSVDSRDPGATAGREHPGMREFIFPGGHRELLPAKSENEVPEEVSWVNIPEWLGANLDRYGWRWLLNKIGNITGQTPNFRRERGSLESWLRKRRQPPDHPAMYGRPDYSLAGSRRR